MAGWQLQPIIIVLRAFQSHTFVVSVLRFRHGSKHTILGYSKLFPARPCALRLYSSLLNSTRPFWHAHTTSSACMCPDVFALAFLREAGEQSFSCLASVSHAACLFWAKGSGLCGAGRVRLFCSPSIVVGLAFLIV